MTPINNSYLVNVPPPHFSLNIKIFAQIIFVVNLRKNYYCKLQKNLSRINLLPIFDQQPEHARDICAP